MPYINGVRAGTGKVTDKQAHGGYAAIRALLHVGQGGECANGHTRACKVRLLTTPYSVGISIIQARQEGHPSPVVQPSTGRPGSGQCIKQNQRNNFISLVTCPSPSMVWIATNSAHPFGSIILWTRTSVFPSVRKP